jgi:hypothetical protein
MEAFENMLDRLSLTIRVPGKQGNCLVEIDD